MTSKTLMMHTFELMQLALLVIVFFGLRLLRAGERRLSRTYAAAGPARRLRDPFAWFLLLSLAILVFTRDMLPLRDLVSHGAALPELAPSLAFALLLALDLLGAALLVAFTGGYAKSPFAPILLMLPLFAILLRERPLRVAGYAAAAALFSALLARRPQLEVEANPLQRQASALVTSGCLGLCALMGYLTQALM